MGEVKFTPATTHGSQAGMKRDLLFTPALPKNLASAGHSIKGGVTFAPSDRGILNRLSFVYTPAWVRNNINPRRMYREYSLDWWTEKAMFNYGALLVSAFYGLDVWDFREHYKIPRKDFLFITDSGGYQIATSQVKIEALDIIRWQEHNSDVALSLDVPPVYAKNMKIVDDFGGFKKCAELSKEYYEIQHRNWTSEDLQILKVIHGGNPKQLDYWYNLVEDIEFSGLAFSPKPLNEEQIAVGLAYLNEKGGETVHMFTGTGEWTTPIVMYAKKFFKRLTYDSSTFSILGAAMRAYNLYQGGRIMFGNSYTSTLKRLPCCCPVCKLATPEELNAEGSLPGGLIALHNLFIYLMYCDFVEGLSDSRVDLMEYLRKNKQADAMKAIEFLDLSDEIGFYDAYDKTYGKGKSDVDDLRDTFR